MADCCAVKRAWLCDFDFLMLQPTLVKAAFDDWKTPSDPKLLFIGKD